MLDELNDEILKYTNSYEEKINNTYEEQKIEEIIQDKYLNS